MFATKAIYKKGVMTIELSLLMPGILAVIILILFTGYYFHDRCIIDRAVYSACVKCVENLNNNEECFNENIDEAAIEYFEKETNDRLIGKWEIEVNTLNTEAEVIVNASGNMACIKGVFSSYLSKAIYSIDIEERAFKTNYGCIYN